jgi:hypothetical protein
MYYLLMSFGGVGRLQTSSNSSTIAADSSNDVTNTRSCRYSCLRSWWWVGVSPETCRAVSRKINCVTLHLVKYIYYNSWDFAPYGSNASSESKEFSFTFQSHYATKFLKAAPRLFFLHVHNCMCTHARTHTKKDFMINALCSAAYDANFKAEAVKLNTSTLHLNIPTL